MRDTISKKRRKEEESNEAPYDYLGDDDDDDDVGYYDEVGKDSEDSDVEEGGNGKQGGKWSSKKNTATEEASNIRIKRDPKKATHVVVVDTSDDYMTISK